MSECYELYLQHTTQLALKADTHSVPRNGYRVPYSGPAGVIDEGERKKKLKLPFVHLDEASCRVSVFLSF